jgi:hypothetical protein
MLFCQMGAAHSLREICGGLGTALGKLTHLGLSGTPNKSTLAYANANRPWQVQQSVFKMPIFGGHTQTKVPIQESALQPRR